MTLLTQFEALLEQLLTRHKICLVKRVITPGGDQIVDVMFVELLLVLRK